MKVYYKSSCVTCRKVMSEMAKAGKDVEKRDIFREPLSEGELKRIIALSGKRPHELLRRRDRMYGELGLGDKKLPDSQIIRLMAENPGLIARPIVIAGDAVHVGAAGACSL